MSRSSTRISALISLSSAARNRRPCKLPSVSKSGSGVPPGSSHSSAAFSRSAEVKKGFVSTALCPNRSASSSPFASGSARNRMGVSAGSASRRALAARRPSGHSASQSRRTRRHASSRIFSRASSRLAAGSRRTPEFSIRTRISSQSSGSPPTAGIQEMRCSFQKARSICSSRTRSSSSTRKREPRFTSLNTSMVPPISSTMLFVMAMPRPVPWTLLVVLFSALVNASKMVSKYSGVMP